MAKTHFGQTEENMPHAASILPIYNKKIQTTIVT